jgi:glycosyltransferase involved in cell wall biosynthesis
MLRISLVTPSYNQGHFLRRTIDSVLAQRGDFDLEYRVLDGASTDDTLEVLRSYGDQVSWVSERDGGQIAAINKGLRAATGDVVGWLNSDDVLQPGALARVARAFEAHPRVEWVHGRCVIIDEHDREIRRWMSQYKHFRCKRHTFHKLLLGENYISQMTAFWRRSVHDEIGYLDPRHDLSFDYDFFLRLAKRGDPIYLDDTIAAFRWYDASKSGEGFVRQLAQATEIALAFGEHDAWMTARTHAKRLTIASIYRLLFAARSAGIPV